MSTEPTTLPPPANDAVPLPPATPPARESFWPHGWWRWMERRVGVVPLPVLIVLIGIVGYFISRGKVPAEMCMMIAVIGVGGFLGMGDKLFAVPWSALRLDTENKRFTLDVTKERLKEAPGFDKDAWPDMANPTWAKGVHDYYGVTPYSHGRM